jgi:hypothetical protein
MLICFMICMNFRLKVEEKLYHDHSSMYLIKIKKLIVYCSYLTRHDQLTLFAYVFFPRRNRDCDCTCNFPFLFPCHFTETCQYIQVSYNHCDLARMKIAQFFCIEIHYTTHNCMWCCIDIDNCNTKFIDYYSC